MRDRTHPDALAVDGGLTLNVEENVEQNSEPDDNLALPISHFKWLFRVSWLISVAFVLSLVYKKWDLVPCAVLVGFTSVNYWRWPDYSWLYSLYPCSCERLRCVKRQGQNVQCSV